MIFLGILVLICAQDASLPTFSFQEFGGNQRTEACFDFGVKLGDVLEVPNQKPTKKKKGGFLSRLKNRERNAQIEQNKGILNHGLRIVRLEKSEHIHPWMQMFHKLEAGIDNSNRIRLLRATLYGENAATQFIIQNRFKNAMGNADYRKIPSTRDKNIRIRVQYQNGVGSTYLENNFPGIGSVWLDPASRAINFGNPGHLGEQGGIYIELFDGTPVVKEITPQIKAKQQENQKLTDNLAEAYMELYKQQGYNETVTMEAYFKIETGMTYTSMKEWFGEPYSSSSIDNTTVYVWRTIVKHNAYRTRERGVGVTNYDPVYGYLKIIFNEKGFVIGKSQEGLK